MSRQTLAARIEFIGLGEADLCALRDLRAALAGSQPGFVEGFYDRLLHFDETSRLLGDSAQLDRLRVSQRQYLDQLLAAEHGPEYAEQRARIGRVHHQVGLQPYLFVQSSALLLTSLIRAACGQFGSDGLRLAVVSEALVKAVMLDVGLAMDAYADADGQALRVSLDRTQESEGLLKEAYEIADLGRWELTIAGDELRVCPRARELLGLDAAVAAEDGVGVGIGVRGGLAGLAALRSQVVPEAREELDRATRRAMEQAETYEIRYALADADGATRWVRERARGMREGNGRIVRLVGTLQDISVRATQVALIRELALYDDLTGLPNRAHFYQELQATLSEAQREKGTFSLLFIDLNRFKEINDSEGHGIGDLILVEVGRRLRDVSRRNELVGRIGGDEFVVIAKGGDALAAASIARRVEESLAPPIVVNGLSHRITASIGTSNYPADGASAEVLVRNADTAMYESKRRRAGPAPYLAEMSQRIGRKVATLAGLRAALQLGAIDVHFQPQVSLDDGRLLGAEALARWHDPTLGQVPPSEFIPLAEGEGLVVELGACVIGASLDRLREWRSADVAADFRLAVNVSPWQLHAPGFAESVIEAVASRGLEAGQIELELTESGVMLDPERAIAVLVRLRQQGFGISVDDFGAGYSSLSYLRGLPITQIKLDRSFVAGMLHSKGDLAIVSAASAMARDLGVSLVAEGVETAEQAARLRELGYRMAQGYYFSRPLPATEFSARWLPASAR